MDNAAASMLLQLANEHRIAFDTETEPPIVAFQSACVREEQWLVSRTVYKEAA